MGKLQFYVLWSLHDAPRQFISKSNRRCFQAHVPLPLPKQLVIFGLGQWESSETTISVDVLVSANVQAQNIGTLSATSRCLTWEGEWNHEIATVAAEKGKKGVYGKIVLTVCGEQDKAGVLSSAPLEGHNDTDLSSPLHQSTMNENMTRNYSQLSDSIFCGETHVHKIDQSDCKAKTPKRTVTGKRTSEDMDNPSEASASKKRMMLRMDSQERREVSTRPPERWSHSMSLIDPNTAVLIGGETSGQNSCKDTLWKLKFDRDFWAPMDSSDPGPVGHSATFDPDSKWLFVYGGLRDGLPSSELHILNTLTWKWTLVNAKGSVPTLAYHSAVFYKKELFVFGGVKPNNFSGQKNCSNALYIFNPEFGLWYQPIVEGEKPLPRFGHSVTLLSYNLVIFGGKSTATYLNDVHILDLGMMEYAAVKCGNRPPLARGFHAALPVSDDRVLVSGGSSAVGALQDVHVFNISKSGL